MGDKIHYQKNREEILKQRSLYYIKNKEKISAQRSQYYAENKEKLQAKQKIYRDNNPDVMKKSRAKWLKTHPLYDHYHNAKRRAKDLNLPFSIHHTDLRIPEYCPILGIKIDRKDGFEHGPSLDRVNPSLGYVKGNVAVISMKANRMKGDASAEEHRKIADYIDSFKI